MSAHAEPSAPAERSEQRTKSTPSGRLLLRMPRTLHAELAQAAEREGTSLNQFITSALTRTVSGEGEEQERPGGQAGGQSRVIAAALVANAVVIGLAAIAAIAVLLVALLG